MRCNTRGCRCRVATNAIRHGKCGGRSFSWWFRVDLAAVGAPRQQRRGGGFKSKADAVEAMNRLQASVVDGTYVERSRLPLGEYPEEWLAACRNIRPKHRSRLQREHPTTSIQGWEWCGCRPPTGSKSAACTRSSRRAGSAKKTVHIVPCHALGRAGRRRYDAERAPRPR